MYCYSCIFMSFILYGLEVVIRKRAFAPNTKITANGLVANDLVYFFLTQRV